MKNKTCCFIGHDRVKRLGMDVELRQALKKLIEEYGVTRFLCSGAGEFDNLCRWNVKIMKNEYGGIRMYRVIPEGLKINKKINALLFDEIVRIAEPNGIDDINKWIMDNSAFAICCVTDKCDSAHRRKEYALKAGLKIINAE